MLFVASIDNLHRLTYLSNSLEATFYAQGLDMYNAGAFEGAGL